jgi:hypothetical protein
VCVCVYQVTALSLENALKFCGNQWVSFECDDDKDD